MLIFARKEEVPHSIICADTLNAGAYSMAGPKDSSRTTM